MSAPSSFSMTVFIITTLISPMFAAKPFSVSGPILTVTLKDPLQASELKTAGVVKSLSSHPNEVGAQRLQQRSSPGSWAGAAGGKLSSISSLSPTLLWSVRSNVPPLPNWFPFLKECSGTVGYRYDDIKNRPSFFEGDARLENGLGELRVNPTYEVKARKASVVLRVGSKMNGGGGAYALARLTTKGKRLLEFVRGSYRMNLPFTTVNSLTLTPSFDFSRSSPSCVMTANTGSGRTAAVLDLNLDDPTLSVVHALDERNTISPEISLHTAKIMYNWSIALDSGSIRTRVDPTSAIQVTWMDRSMNGKWVTDFKLPLEGRPGPLAADIRVRRQFIF